MKTAAIILAAGASTRLGKPKQLLVFNGKTLVKTACEAALEAGCSPVIILTGKEHEALLPEIPAGVQIVHHQNWAAGMGSTIAAGVQELQTIPGETGSVLIQLSDQPFAGSEILRKLMHAKNTGEKGIVASAYAGTLGAPVLFDRKYFPMLSALTGDSGAKKILKKFSEDVASADFPLGKVDVDTSEDYQGLNGQCFK